MMYVKTKYACVNIYIYIYVCACYVCLTPSEQSYV